jgi:glycosyltransferase involved in cell wall biosynthesis
LLQNDHVVQIAVLHSKEDQPYIYDGVLVTPLLSGHPSLIHLLKKENFDVGHFQEYSDNGINISWMKTVKQYCKRVFFTFHLPYLTCYKNDFRYYRIEDCDVFTSTDRCLNCIIATRLKYQKKWVFKWHKTLIDLAIPFLKKSRKIQKVKINIQQRKQDLASLIDLCDQAFIYGAWFKRLLMSNGFNSPKLKLISHMDKIKIERKLRNPSMKKQVIFVGRIEKAKGLHLLTKAMNLIKTKDLELNVVGNIVDKKYFESCQREFFFHYQGVLQRQELLKTFVDYDFLILPSEFTEMYSLVLREAFYEQLPVIVSSAKGNKDVVVEERNGFIFEYGSSLSLAIVIDKAYNLLTAGWKAAFTYSENTEKDIEEILSYYEFDKRI